MSDNLMAFLIVGIYLLPVGIVFIPSVRRRIEWEAMRRKEKVYWGGE
jgi:hypothetical protein